MAHMVRFVNQSANVKIVLLAILHLVNATACQSSQVTFVKFSYAVAV